MADETRRGSRGEGAGDTSAAGGGATGPIGEAEADEFAGDVAAASGGESVAHDPGAAIPDAAGGGTGIGDMAGGTGIGTSDGGDDDAGTGGTAGGEAAAGGR